MDEHAAPQGTMAGFEPGRWWRVLAPGGSLWCETSDEQEARGSMRPGYRLQRIYQRKETEWRDENLQGGEQDG